MDDIPRAEVVGRLRADNPWWTPPHGLPAAEAAMQARAFLDLFLPLVRLREVRRAVLLLGPRRVGKTILLMHTIGALIEQGVGPQRLWYIAVDSPLFTGRRLDELVEIAFEASGLMPGDQEIYVLFDEIQYRREWEVHLKVLVDQYRDIKFVASGSSAAALRLKSQESGAGRFTDFLLPPLSFFEYLQLRGHASLIEETDEGGADIGDIHALNSEFVDYLNYGGFPEVALSERVRADAGRFVRSDIVDKVLLRDLPSLYGIDDVQELNALFTVLAFNTAREVSIDELGKRASNVTKPTLKRYLEYLQAAFLIRVVHRVDQNARRFKRVTQFKVYLTNTAMYAALFAPVAADDRATPYLVETAVFGQWFHDPGSLHYARWDRGPREVDMVWLNPDQTPGWATEVKWSDHAVDRPDELGGLVRFTGDHALKAAWVTTRSVRVTKVVSGVELRFVPTALYAWAVGRSQIRRRRGPDLAAFVGL